MSSNDRDYNKLRGAIDGVLTVAGDARWDEARRSWNLFVDQRPAAVLEAASVEDVQAAVAFAGENALRVAPQGTGHGSEPLGPLGDAMLLKTSNMREISFDPDRGVARAQAGALAGELADAAGAHGRAPVLGFATTVGATGLALSGGIGWLSRTRGLACNNVAAFDLVLASGESVRADAREHPDLFWALRGGGGRSAIVTSLEFVTHDVPDAYGGMILWPADRAPDVLHRFGALTREAPETLSLVFRYLSVPDVEGPPPPLRGRKFAGIIAVNLGPESEGVQWLASLRGTGEVIDTCKALEPAELVRIAGDPETPSPACGGGFLFEDLDTDAFETVASLLGSDAVSALTVVEIRHLGGALSRAPEGHGALATLPGNYSCFASGAAPSPEVGAAVDGCIAQVRERLGPWTAERALLSSAAAGTDPASGFDAETFSRLRAIEQTHDPGRLILSNRDV
jgi:hypothetical protein